MVIIILYMRYFSSYLCILSEISLYIYLNVSMSSCVRSYLHHWLTDIFIKSDMDFWYRWCFYTESWCAMVYMTLIYCEFMYLSVLRNFTRDEHRLRVWNIKWINETTRRNGVNETISIKTQIIIMKISKNDVQWN